MEVKEEEMEVEMEVKEVEEEARICRRRRK